MKKLFIYTLILIFSFSSIRAENGKLPVIVSNPEASNPTPASSSKVLYGTASFYSNSFNGKQTANGEIFSQKKFTGASNFLPLDTWVRVTNLKNGKSVVVKVTDRMHKRMKRVIDLSRVAASQLSYIGDGLTKVKIELLGKTKPAGV
jgi:peptidoglycan lytic transglycosylase